MKVKSEKLKVKAGKSGAAGRSTYKIGRSELTFSCSVSEKKRDRAILIKAVSVLFFLFTFHFSLSASSYADQIRSRAAVVMDAATGRILYAKNPDIRLLPASTTKLMTALVVVEKANLNDVVTISRKAAGTSATRAGFRAGDKVTVETLLYAALMKSANDAAVALAEGIGGSEEQFVRMMNTKAVAIGANDTRFVNSNGLPGKGQYITAYDLSMIMRQAIKYPVLREILKTRTTELSTETGKTLTVKSTNKLLWSDDEILGGKTGYTRRARHCFVCAGERDNETIIVALLGAPVRDLLWKESEELISYGSQVMANQKEPLVYSSGGGFGPKAVSNIEMAEAGTATLAAAERQDEDYPAKKIIKHTKHKRTRSARKKGVMTASRKSGGKSVVLVADGGAENHKKKSPGKRKSSRMMAKKWKKQRIAKKAEYGSEG